MKISAWDEFLEKLEQDLAHAAIAVSKKRGALSPMCKNCVYSYATFASETCSQCVITGSEYEPYLEVEDDHDDDMLYGMTQIYRSRK